MVQYKLPKVLCTLLQRLGRAARDKSLKGEGVLIAESKYFDDEIAKAEARALQRQLNAAKALSTGKKRKNAPNTKTKRVRVATPCAIILIIKKLSGSASCHKSYWKCWRISGKGSH